MARVASIKRVLAVAALVVATGSGDATAQTGSSTPGPSSHADRSGPGPDGNGKVIYVGPAPATQARVGFTG